MYVTVVQFVLLAGFLIVGQEAVPNALAHFWKPIPHSGLPCPALQGEELSSTAT